MSSPEYLLGHGASPPTVVQGYYADLAGRAADPAGDAQWANLLWQGMAPSNVLRIFQGCARSRGTLVATWFVQDLGRSTSIAQLKLDPGVQGLAAYLNNL